MSGTVLVVDDRDTPGSGNAAYKWRVVLSHQVLHLRDRDRQRLCHFGTGDIARPEVEFPDPVPPQGVTLYFVVTIPLVLGQHDPSSFGDEMQPDLIGCAAWEVVPVPLVLDMIAR